MSFQVLTCMTSAAAQYWSVKNRTAVGNGSDDMQKKRKTICRLVTPHFWRATLHAKWSAGTCDKAIGILPRLLTTGTISRDMETSRQTRFKNYTYVNLEKMIHIPAD